MLDQTLDEIRESIKKSQQLVNADQIHAYFKKLGYVNFPQISTIEQAESIHIFSPRHFVNMQHVLLIYRIPVFLPQQAEHITNAYRKRRSEISQEFNNDILVHDDGNLDIYLES